MSDRDQPSSDPETYGLGPAAGMELAQNGADVEFDRTSAQEAELIGTFLARRLGIPPEVRRYNAQRIAEMISTRLNIPRESRPSDNEYFLELMVREFRSRAR